MPLYLGRFSYTADAIRALVANPQDRAASAAELFESLGAKLIRFWYAFGEFDSTASSWPKLQTTPRHRPPGWRPAIGRVIETRDDSPVDMSEAQEAMRKAAAATYRPPS